MREGRRAVCWTGAPTCGAVGGVWDGGAYLWSAEATPAMPSGKATGSATNVPLLSRDLAQQSSMFCTDRVHSERESARDG